MTIFDLLIAAGKVESEWNGLTEPQRERIRAGARNLWTELATGKRSDGTPTAHRRKKSPREVITEATGPPMFPCARCKTPTETRKDHGARRQLCQMCADLDTLGLDHAPRDAGELRAARRMQAAHYHPDKPRGSEDAMREINAAFNRLNTIPL